MPFPARLHHPRGLSALGRPLAAAVAAGALLVGAAGAASAHDQLVSTVPGADTTVQNAPEAVSLGFSSVPLELGAQVLVTAPDGTVVSQGAPEVAGVDVVQGLAPDRPAGTYTVTWRVTSSDGHPIEGGYAFEATTAVGAAASPSPSASSPAASESASAEPSMTTMAEPTPTSTVDATAASADSDGGGGISGSTWAWTIAAGLAGAALGTVLVRARRRANG